MVKRYFFVTYTRLLLLALAVFPARRNDQPPSPRVCIAMAMAAMWKSSLLSSFLLLLLQPAAALPTGTFEADIALITPPPDPRAIYAAQELRRRGVISDITAALNSDLNSIFSELGSAVPSYVASGVLPAFQGYPTGSSAILKSVGGKSSDLDAQPTQVLNLPGYGNWTELGWNLRFHGNVFKAPANVPNATWNDLANKFLINTKVQNLPPAQSAQAVNLTKEIFVVQQANQNVTFNVLPGPSDVTGGVTTAAGSELITLPYETTKEGDFDVFLPLTNATLTGLTSLTPGNGSVAPQTLSVYANGTDTGNATSYLISTNGLTVVSDIDDTLRVTKIYEPAQGLLNTFARPFTNWMNMPDIYANWSKSLPELHFHYLTTTPEQITRNYMQYTLANYPGGSFDTRPLNFSDVSATLSIRKFLLVKLFQTFPHRKFILMGDTSNSDVMRDYPAMATEFPGQVQCILIRNISSTDAGDKFPYDTSGFKNLNQQNYMFYHVPNDLTNLDIVGGHCLNSTIKQNVTFSYQGLPFGLSDSSSGAAEKARSKAAAFLIPLIAFMVIAL